MKERCIKIVRTTNKIRWNNKRSYAVRLIRRQASHKAVKHDIM